MAQTSVKSLGIQTLDHTATSTTKSVTLGWVHRGYLGLCGALREQTAGLVLPRVTPSAAPSSGQCTSGLSKYFLSGAFCFICLQPCSLWTTLCVTLRMLSSSLCISVPSNRGGPVGCMSRKDLSLRGSRVAAPWLGWPPLGKLTGRKMGRGKKQTHRGCPSVPWWESGIHPSLADPGMAPQPSASDFICPGHSFPTSSVVEITGLCACPEYSKDPAISVSNRDSHT